MLGRLLGLFCAVPKPCVVAVLGVTPELVHLPWPAPVELRAYDHSAQMIAAVWRPHPAVACTVTRADWRCIPAEASSFQAVVGDGALNVLPGLSDYGSVLRELHRVLAPGGSVVLRCFIRPDRPETLAQVRAAVSGGTVGSFHALKWRLAMSLANGPGASVAVTAIHDAFVAAFPSPGALADMTGWPFAVIDTIDAYRGASTRYSFPTLSELRQACLPYFDLADIAYGTYELAERYPTLTLTRRSAGVALA